MADTSDTSSSNPQESSEAQSGPDAETRSVKRSAERQDTAKVLDDIARVRPQTKTRAQRKARIRVIALIVLTLPLLVGLVWLAWQQWQLGSNLPQLEARLALVEGGELRSSQLAPERAAELSPQQETQVAALIEAARARIESDMQSLIESIAADISGSADSQLSSEARERRIVELASQAVQSALSEFDAQLVQQQSATTAELTRLRNQVAEFGARVRAVDATPSRQWKLLEAEYLLAMASRKLRFERDVIAAIALYELADTALAESASDEAYPLRQALAGELASLRAVELPDTESLFLRLDILLAQADSIALEGTSIDGMRTAFQSEQLFAPVPETGRTPKAETSLPRQLMDESFEFLRSVFVWRRLDEPAQALVAARLGGARELKLILEQAKLALLAGDEILFDRQLDSARLWIERNGKQDMASVDAVLTELDQLKGIALQPRLPLIGGALRGVAELNASTRL